MKKIGENSKNFKESWIFKNKDYHTPKISNHNMKLEYFVVKMSVYSEELIKNSPSYRDFILR